MDNQKRDWLPTIIGGVISLVGILVPLLIIAVTGFMKFAALEEDVRLMREDIKEIKSILHTINQNHIDHLTQLHAKRVSRLPDSD